MTADFFRVIPATTDGSGNITFTVPPPAGPNLAWQGTVSVNSGDSGFFTATSGGGAESWGSWAASSPYGPVTIRANDTLTITGTGLLPKMTYLCQVLGIANYYELLAPQYPPALGATGLYGTQQILDVKNKTITPGNTDFYRYYPCTQFGSLRLAVRCQSGGPIEVDVFWWNLKLDRVMGSRTYVLFNDGVNGEGQKLEVDIPHFGDMLEIRVICNQNE